MSKIQPSAVFTGLSRVNLLTRGLYQCHLATVLAAGAQSTGGEVSRVARGTPHLHTRGCGGGVLGRYFWFS